MLAVFGAGALVLGTAESASAVPMVINFPADLSNITDTVVNFAGQGDPGESVTVDPGANGNICNTTADASATGTCNVTFTVSALGVNVTATGSTSGATTSTPTTSPSSP